MSGVEAAGFVLAAIPLVIAFIEPYAKGVKTIKFWRGYKQEVAKLYSCLKTEQTLFLDTCEWLLQDIESSEQDLELLVSNPGGREWARKDVEQDLQSKLSPRSYEAFITMTKDMRDAVEALKERLGLNEAMPNDDASIKTQLKRLKNSLTRKAFDDLLERIRADNQALRQLVHPARDLEQARKGKKRYGQGLFFKHVRQCAVDMFDAVSGALKCSCLETHNVSLRLSPRKQISGSGMRSQDTQELDFPVIISHNGRTVKAGKTPMLWSEIKIRLVVQESASCSSIKVRLLSSANSSPSKQASSGVVTFSDSVHSTTGWSSSSQTVLSTQSTSSQTMHLSADQTSNCQTSTNAAPTSFPRISDLCCALRDFESTKSQDCLGLLVTADRSFQVIPSADPYDIHDYDSPLVSLGSILHRKCNKLPVLLLADKLRVAVAVASSVLQLHESHWLSSNWSKSNIFFVHRASRDPYVDTFVSRPLSVESKPKSNDENSTNSLTRFIRNHTIFALGILLIELCLGKPIEELRTAEDSPWEGGIPNALTDLYTADRIIKTGQLSKQASLGQQSAIVCCIHCDFGQGNADLEDDKFRQAVYDLVIVPLEHDLKAFEEPLYT